MLDLVQMKACVTPKVVINFLWRLTASIFWLLRFSADRGQSCRASNPTCLGTRRTLPRLAASTSMAACSCASLCGNKTVARAGLLVRTP